VLTLLIALVLVHPHRGGRPGPLDEPEGGVIAAILEFGIAAGVIIVANPDIGLTTLALLLDRVHRARHG
jgi:hypothetical protein